MFHSTPALVVVEYSPAKIFFLPLILNLLNILSYNFETTLAVEYGDKQNSNSGQNNAIFCILIILRSIHE